MDSDLPKSSDGQYHLDNVLDPVQLNSESEESGVSNDERKHPATSKFLKEQTINTEDIDSDNFTPSEKTHLLLAKQIINLEDTFWHMKQRQWGRLYRASYGRPRAFTMIYLIFYSIAYGIYLSLQIAFFNRQIDYTLEYILMAFITAVIGFVSPMFSWYIRIILFEGYTFFYMFFIMNLYSVPRLYVPLGCIFVGILLLTSINFLLYPIIVRAWYFFAGRLSPKIEVGDSDLGVTRYEIEQTSFFGSPYKCVYEGPLVKGQPSGFGTWVDTSFQGELLQGYWENGIPVGPFEAIENDTRSILVNLRIVYASNAGGKGFLQRVPLSYGIASVETCVSGNFFKGYPIVSMITGPLSVKSPEDIRILFEKREYKHIDEEKITTNVTVSIDKRNKVLNVTGHHSLVAHPSSVTIQLTKSQQPQQHEEKSSKDQHHQLQPKRGTFCLSLDSTWDKSDAREGILFIHGIFHTLEDACKRFGQFLALGHFPPHLKPFLFNWPASTNPLLYWCASSVASDTDTHRDLKRFIRMLKKSGIETLHIMCHSMGSRFFLRSFAAIQDLFEKRSIKSIRDSGSFILPTSMSSPRGSLDVPSSTTRESKDSKRNGIILQNLIFLNPDYEVDTFVNDYLDLQQYTPNVTIYADSRDLALRMAENVTGKKSLGLSTLAGRKNDPNSLLYEGIDIIDTADLDRNMNTQFHGYFNINRAMVDDLYELIVTGKRAEERSSRLKRYKHVFRFTIVPSSVVIV